MFSTFDSSASSHPSSPTKGSPTSFRPMAYSEATGLPHMVIKSVHVRSLSPSLSLSASVLAHANGVQPMSPIGFSISTFSHAASPVNSPLTKKGPMWRGFDTVGLPAESFVSGSFSQPVNKHVASFDQSASLSNVLLAVTGYKQPEAAIPLEKSEENICKSPTPFFVDTNANEDEPEERFPIMRRMTRQGPLADSCAPTPRIEAEKLPPKHFKHAARVEVTLTPEDSPIDNQRNCAHNAILSSPVKRDIEPLSLHGYDNTMLSDTVLGSPQEELFSQGLFSLSLGASNTSSAVRPVNWQSANSMTSPQPISPAQHPACGMFTPDDAGLPTAMDSNLGASDYPKQNVLPFFAEFNPTISIVPAPEPAVPATKFQPPITLREATPADAEGIIALRNSLDMTNATSYVWELEDMKERILNRYPLTLVALSPDPREDSPTKGTEMVVGVTGIDVLGMEKDFPVFSIGSRLLGVPRNQEYVFPYEYCMCRGLLIHPLFQGCGLGSKLHKGRLTLLAAIAPNVSVILSARGSTIEETLSVIVPYMEARTSAPTPEFTKDELFEFTFHTSQGIVHMVHGKDRDGWKFVGVDVADGGPVWLTSKPLTEIVRIYDTEVKLSPHNVATKLNRAK